MRKPSVEFTVIKEDKGYSAYAETQTDAIFTQGDDFAELRNNLVDAANTAYEDRGVSFSYSDLKVEFDLESFFEFYGVLNVSALSKRIGMNRSLLSQYISGKKKPSSAQTEKILSGVQEIGRELTEVNLLH